MLIPKRGNHPCVCFMEFVPHYTYSCKSKWEKIGSARTLFCASLSIFFFLCAPKADADKTWGKCQSAMASNGGRRGLAINCLLMTLKEKVRGAFLFFFINRGATKGLIVPRATTCGFAISRSLSHNPSA